jgi:hypothetical protein
MSSWKRNIKNALPDGAKSFPPILLLVIFLGGNTTSGLFHQLFHARDSSLLHSAQQEKDPCHRTLHHFEKKTGCKHQSHVRANEKCDQCHLLSHKDKVGCSNSLSEPIPTPSIINNIPAPHQLTGITLTLPSRAPPVI